MGNWTPGEGHLGDLKATKSTVNKDEEKAPNGNRIFIQVKSYTVPILSITLLQRVYNLNATVIQ